MAIKAFFSFLAITFLELEVMHKKWAFVIVVATRFVVYNLKSKEYVA